MRSYILIAAIVVFALLSVVHAVAGKSAVRKVSLSSAADARLQLTMDMHNTMKEIRATSASVLKASKTSVAYAEPTFFSKFLTAIGLKKEKAAPMSFTHPMNSKMSSQSLFDGINVTMEGYFSYQLLTRNVDKLATMKKRCRKNLQPRQVTHSVSSPLGCRANEMNSHVSSAVVCFSNVREKTYELGHAVWFNSSNCDGAPNEVLQSLATPQCSDKLTQGHFSKFSCGPMAYTPGIEIANYQDHGDCLSNNMPHANMIMHYGNGNCHDSHDKVHDRWTSMSIQSCRPSNMNFNNVMVNASVFNGKSCRQSNFIQSIIEMNAFEIFDGVNSTHECGSNNEHNGVTFSSLKCV